MKKQVLTAISVAIFGYLALVLEQSPILGSSLLAMLLGLFCTRFFGNLVESSSVLTWFSKKGLQYSIILLGFRLSFRDIQSLGLWSLQLSLPLAFITLSLSLVLGRWLGLKKRLSLLIGFGTAICGGSAIATAAPVLEGDEEEVGLALSTIFVFNLIGLLLFPILGRLQGLTQVQFGIWAGTAINDTSSVLAASYDYGKVAGDIATVVKLARTLLIVPFCLGFALFPLRKWQSGNRTFSLTKIVPAFVLAFLLAAILSSLNLVPPSVLTISQKLSKWLMAMALFAVGCKLSFSHLKATGWSPIILGGLVWFLLSVLSLLLQFSGLLLPLPPITF